MRIRGLGPNDARRSRYQLWIFDAARDERFRGGGVVAGRERIAVLAQPAKTWAGAAGTGPGIALC